MMINVHHSIEHKGKTLDSFFCSSPTVNFAYLTVLLTVCEGKINLGPRPGKFVTVPVDWNFLIIVLTVDVGIFR